MESLGGTLGGESWVGVSLRRVALTVPPLAIGPTIHMRSPVTGHVLSKYRPIPKP